MLRGIGSTATGQTTIPGTNSANASECSYFYTSSLTKQHTCAKHLPLEHPSPLSLARHKRSIVVPPVSPSPSVRQCVVHSRDHHTLLRLRRETRPIDENDWHPESSCHFTVRHKIKPYPELAQFSTLFLSNLAREAMRSASKTV